MQRSLGRKMVIWISVGIGIASVLAALFLRIQGKHVPIPVDVGVTYGVLFSVTLYFDSMAQKISRFERASNRASARPVPSRPQTAGQAVALSPAYAVSPGAVRLERVTAESQPLFAEMARAALTEVWALEGKVPQEEDFAQVEGVSPGGQKGAFLIHVQGRAVGACAMVDTGNAYEVEVIYIQSEHRRRQIGRTALDKLREFAAMLGIDQRPLRAQVSASNVRAQMFLGTAGFSPVAEEADGNAQVWQRSLS